MIYGYIFDGYALHPGCVESPEDQRDVDEGEAGALYSHMDDGNDGLGCDKCGEYIFEPFPEGQLTDAIEDILLSQERDWTKASRILELFRANGFEMPSYVEL